MIVLIAAAAGGCGRPAGPVFEPLESPPRWPGPPDPARIEYVGDLTSSGDLKPGESVFESIGAALFGRDPDRALLSPFAVCTDDGERVFVADSNAQVVHVFDLETREYEQWQPEGGIFAQPVGVAWDPAGRLIVSDSVAGSLFAFAADGTSLGALGGAHLVRPSGIVVDPADGRIIVADTTAHQIVVLEPDGRLRRRVGTRGNGPGTFNFPTNVTLDHEGRLYVADTLNFRVQVFSPALEPIAAIGSQGDLPGYFAQPKGLAVDSDGHLYVVDAQFEAVQIFDREGRLLLAFGREGRGPGEFWLPAGIHVDRQDRIWIADSYNRRVQVFRYLGAEP